MNRYILMSIQSKYARKILDGTKTWEYRKNAPRIPGSHLPSTVFIYSSGEDKAIVGEFTCGNVVRASFSELISKTNLENDPKAVGWMRRYYKGVRHCTALEVSKTQRYPEPLPLSEIRRNIPGFRPPQNFFYVPSDSRLTELLARNRQSR